jgi:hypothetical protein
MPDKLARFISGIGKTQTVDCIVQSPFQKGEKDFSSDAFFPIRFFEGVAELVFQNAIQSFDFLLFSQLGPVI